jgi:ribosomal protein L37AE/L43A
MTKQERAAKKAELAASLKRIRETQEETRAIVATGKCPQCGRPLRRNWSMTGWWQCVQFGAVGFRENSTQPPCNWQGFVE